MFILKLILEYGDDKSVDWMYRNIEQGEINAWAGSVPISLEKFLPAVEVDVDHSVLLNHFRVTLRMRSWFSWNLS